MKLLIDPKLMQRFLSMRPKVFLAASDTPCDLGEWSAGPEPFCDAWVVETTTSRDQGWLRLLPQSGKQDCESVSVLQPPATLSILAARSPAGHAELEAFRAWWNSNAPAPAPAIHALTGAAAELPNEIMRPLLQIALIELDQSAAQFAGLAKQLYLLRTEHEDTRTALQALQEQQGRVRQGLQLTASLAPAGTTFTPDRVQGTLTQYLPIAAKRLAGLDLHFAGTRTGRGTGHLLVGLYALDRDEPLGAWRVPFENIRSGWARFALPEALSLAAHDLQLTVSWYGSAELMPNISLSDVGDWHEMRAKTDDSVDLDGGLALMLWSAPPGTKLQGGLERGTYLPGRGWEFRVSQSDLARAVLSSPDRVPQASFSVLQELPGGGLLLHPTGPNANVAYVPEGCIVGTQQVSAIVKTNHPNAEGTVQYALLATRHEPAWELTRLDDPAADPRVVAFSGWQNVPPDQQPYAVCLNFLEPLEQPAHLVLATRSFESTVCAWAHWLEFRMRLCPPVRAFESQPHDVEGPNSQWKIPA